LKKGRNTNRHSAGKKMPEEKVSLKKGKSAVGHKKGEADAPAA